MKRKESCNEGGPSKKKKCNHPPSVDPSSIVNPTSTNPIDPIVDPTFTNPVDPSFNTSSSPNPNPNPASSSNPNPTSLSNEDISFFNDDCKHRYDNCFYNRPLLLERGVVLDELKDVGLDVIFALRRWNSSVHIKKMDKTYNTLVKIFYSNLHDIDKVNHKFKSLVRKSLGKEKNKKTQPQQPQVEIQNEVAPEDNIATQAIPNSSTSGLPSLDERLSIYASVMI
ncbi:unnamed protein product [Ilex paraguariensis]|uniref:Uncharacterized protein n=1 Tax=Ilex paraguariensis TaxID=185542 RepID=A0ABC8RKJ1_9AQUA